MFKKTDVFNLFWLSHTSSDSESQNRRFIMCVCNDSESAQLAVGRDLANSLKIRSLCLLLCLLLCSYVLSWNVACYVCSCFLALGAPLANQIDSMLPPRVWPPPGPSGRQGFGSTIRARNLKHYLGTALSRRTVRLQSIGPTCWFSLWAHSVGLFLKSQAGPAGAPCPPPFDSRP